MELKLKGTKAVGYAGDLVVMTDGTTRLICKEGNGSYFLINPQEGGRTTLGTYSTIERLLEGLSIQRIIPSTNLSIVEL
jgi:hypothetical protein